MICSATQDVQMCFNRSNHSGNKQMKRSSLIPSASLILCLPILPLVTSSIRQLSLSLFDIRKPENRRKSLSQFFGSPTSTEFSRLALSDSIVLRGGHADYYGDDLWEGDLPENASPPTVDDRVSSRKDPRFQSHQHLTKNPDGSTSAWRQNNGHLIPQQKHWDGSRAYDSESHVTNSYDKNESQNPKYDDDQILPGSEKSPYRGYQSYPCQQHQQGQFKGQQFPQSPQYQQQHPTSQGMYPPPPNLPDFGDDGNQGNRINPVRNSHVTSHRMADPAYDDEDEDDLLPFTAADELNGMTMPGKTLQNQGDSGGMDLSQFDKEVIFSGLKRLYRKKIRPLEISSKYGHFHSPPLSPSDFDAKPMVLLLGQYSVGKTSFIRYLLGRDFPGQRIGPEPTTDRFVAIVKGESGDKIIPGAALCSQADRPFRGLSSFGNNFLSRFEGVEMDAPILNNITLIDTPGILSGQKQSIGRNYDYEQVMKWFAERADLIIIMFDAHKLDISDELKRVIELLKPHQDKMRVLLNKADSISTQQLMRVYGALMWSLGKVMMTPEVCRVFMGSFWGAPLKNKEQSTLLNREKLDLFNDIAQLPQNAVMRRINELVKRARSVKVHAYIIHYLRKQLPYTWGKREKQRRLIDRLDREFVMCARRYELPKGDFPELEPFRQALLEIKDLSEIHKLDKKMVKEMDKVFSVDIPNLLEIAKYH